MIEEIRKRKAILAHLFAVLAIGGVVIGLNTRRSSDAIRSQPSHTPHPDRLVPPPR